MTFLFILIICFENYSQFKVDFDYDLIELKYSRYIVFDFNITNNQSFDQILYLQNWRLASAANLDYIIGSPSMTNLVNKFYLIKKNQNFTNSFLGDDQSYGSFLCNSFKLLKKNRVFNIHIVILDTTFINLFVSNNFDLYYVFSYTKYNDLEELITQDTDNSKYFYHNTSLTMFFNKSDYGTELNNYNIKHHNCKDAEFKLEKLFDIDKKFKKEIFKYSLE